MPVNQFFEKKRTIYRGILFDMKTIFIENYSQQKKNRKKLVNQVNQRRRSQKIAVWLFCVCVCGDSGLNIS